MIWQPYFSPLPVLACGMLVAVLALTATARTLRAHPWLSISTGMMRLALIALVVALLMGPSILPEASYRDTRPDLTILLDSSASMQTRDMGDASRYDFAVRQWLSDELIAQLDREYDLKLLLFDKSVRSASLSALRKPGEEVATGQATHLAHSIQTALERIDGKTAGSSLLLISDGRDSEDASLMSVAKLAAARGVAVHSVAMGGPTLQRDVALIGRPMQEYLFAGERGTITAEVVQTNAGQARTTLHMRCGDEHVQHEIAFEGRDRVIVQLPIRQDEPGFYEYELMVDAVAGELEVANNRQTVFMEVTAQRLKVLLLEGQPFWDTKFLAQSLRKDERVELTQVTQISARRQERVVTRTQADGPVVPQTLEDLAQYDVIILGRALEHVLDEQTAALLPRYVGEHGGQLVFARGRPYDAETPQGRAIGRALSVIEPVVWGRGVIRDQRIALAPAGEAHPSFVGNGGVDATVRLIDELPEMTIMPVITREKASAQVLARTRPIGGGSAEHGQPAIVTMPYERGMVMAVLGEGLWKWSLLARQNEHLVGVFDQFWSNTVRWLSMGSDYQPGEAVTLRLSQRTVQVGESISFDAISRAFLNEPNLRVQVLDPAGDLHEPALRSVGGPGRSRSIFLPNMPGVYEVVLSSSLAEVEPLRQKFSAFEVDVERLRAAANPGELRRLSDETGGRFLDPDRPGDLIDALARHRASMQVPPHPHFIWDQGWILVMLLGWAGLEWLVRKKGGLL